MPSKHMMVFLNQTLFKELGITSDPDTLRAANMYQLGFHVPAEHMQRAWRYQPTTKDYVNAMKELGFSPTFISGYLKISRANISYHLKADYKPYTNPYLSGLEHDLKN